MNRKGQHPKRRGKKRAYAPPKLVFEGGIEEVTKTGAGPSKDSAMGNPGGKS